MAHIDSAYIDRCMTDPVFFMQNELKVRAENRRIVEWGELFPTQAKVQAVIDDHRRRRRPCRIIVLKARRHRISALVAANAFHAAWSTPGTRAIITAHDADTSKVLFKFHQNFLQYLRPEMRPMVRSNRDGVLHLDNPNLRDAADNPGLDSWIMVQIAGGKGRRPEGEGQEAAGIARGDRVDIFHGSECAFWTRGGELADSLAQSVPQEPDTLVVLESTANGQAGYFYEEWERAEKGQSGYVPIFLAWFEHPEYSAFHLARTEPEWGPTADELGIFDDYRCAIVEHDDAAASVFAQRLQLDEEEQLLVRQHGLGWDRLKWRRWRILVKLRNKVDKFHVEFPSNPTEAFAATGGQRFDGSKISYFMGRSEPRLRNGWLRVFGPAGWNPLSDGADQPDIRFAGADSFDYVGDGDPLFEMLSGPEPGKTYIVTADASEGVGQDEAAMVVMERQTRTFVAQLHDDRLKPDALAAWAVRAGWFYNGALIVPEATGVGLTTTTYVANSGYPNVYRRRKVGSGEDMEIQDVYGFATDTKSRPRLIDRFDVAISNDEFTCRLRDIWDQARTFIRYKPRNQRALVRVEAAPNAKDDILFAAMIAFLVNEIVPPDAVWSKPTGIARAHSWTMALGVTDLEAETATGLQSERTLQEFVDWFF